MDFIDPFSQYKQGRGRSGSLNKSREDILAYLFSDQSGVDASVVGRMASGVLMEIKSKFETAIKNALVDFSMVNTPDPELTVKPFGGRGNRFDFKVFSNSIPTSQGVKIELKRGESIFKQPQFIQLYAKRGILTLPHVEPYAEWLYGNYGNRLETSVGEALPPKDEYLKLVFGTNIPKDSVWFSKARELWKSDKSGVLEGLHHRSVDEYIRLVSSSAPDNLDLSWLSEMLKEQQSKLFVSWDPGPRKFVVERFNHSDCSLTGSYSLKMRRGSQLVSSICLHNEAGNSIDWLLRWKNGPLVLGPAWQVSLRETGN